MYLLGKKYICVSNRFILFIMLDILKNVASDKLLKIVLKVIAEDIIKEKIS